MVARHIHPNWLVQALPLLSRRFFSLFDQIFTHQKAYPPSTQHGRCEKGTVEPFLALPLRLRPVFRPDRSKACVWPTQTGDRRGALRLCNPKHTVSVASSGTAHVSKEDTAAELLERPGLLSSALLWCHLRLQLDLGAASAGWIVRWRMRSAGVPFFFGSCIVGGKPGDRWRTLGRWVSRATECNL